MTLQKSTQILYTGRELEDVFGVDAFQGQTKIDGVTTVAIDSREVVAGSLFVALVGEKQDGHAYIDVAIEQGAKAVLCHTCPEVMQNGVTYIVVKDTLEGLDALARFGRARSSAVCFAITGSVGKTGTKSFLYTALAAQERSYASPKSYNNHWGVPYTLSNLPADKDSAVFEVGTSNPGEIAPLVNLIRPDIAIVTAVEPVHIENFESVEAIAREKAQITAFMNSGHKRGGVVILPMESPYFEALKEEAIHNKVDTVLTFGESEGADAQLINAVVASNGVRVTARILDQEVSYVLKSAGHHQAMNSLSVLLAVAVHGGDVAKAAAALETMDLPEGRGRREQLDYGDQSNPVTLIDESYNASPVAMRAAFKVLAMIDPGRGGRRIAILGDMYELGSNAAKSHEELALPLQSAGVDLVYTSGPLMKKLRETLPANKRAAHCDDTQELAKIVPDALVPGDVVMVKGSRGGGEKPRMQLVVEAMREYSKKAQSATQSREA